MTTTKAIPEVSTTDLHEAVGICNREHHLSGGATTEPSEWLTVAGLKILERFGEQGEPILARVLALCRYLESGSRWAYRTGESANIMPELWQAAASCPLDITGRFDRKQLEAICSGKPQDESQAPEAGTAGRAPTDAVSEAPAAKTSTPANVPGLGMMIFAGAVCGAGICGLALVVRWLI